jgi:hypothetical protein
MLDKILIGDRRGVHLEVGVGLFIERSTSVIETPDLVGARESIALYAGTIYRETNQFGTHSSQTMTQPPGGSLANVLRDRHQIVISFLF